MKMSLRYYLILMTLVAVLSDYLLHPFYPQFFEAAFGVTSPTQVGYYFSAICFMVMLAFPFWAYVSQRVPELKILVYTQMIAGVLATYCYFNSSYVWFWTASLTMIFFKGSYLLVYPYILRIGDPEKHVETIGLLSVIVHFGSILGAVVGGGVVEYVSPRNIFIVMAAGDFVQMCTSWYLLKSSKYQAQVHHPVAQEKHTIEKRMPALFVWKVGVASLTLYFSYFIISPFFSQYWEYISAWDSKMVSGAVYAIPGFVALIALWFNKRYAGAGQGGIIIALLWGLLGLILQSSGSIWAVVVGRVIYGWAIFQSMVRLDALLFDLSAPEDYALNYSKIHFFQNLGVLLASFSAGLTVQQQGLRMPFFIAICGFLLTVALYFFYFKQKPKHRIEVQVAQKQPIT